MVAGRVNTVVSRNADPVEGAEGWDSMAIESLAEALEREHHEIDGGIEAFAAEPPRDEYQTGRLAAAVTALRRHIYLEEEFLFPPLRAAGLVGPVLVMVREHARMWASLDALEDELASGGAGGTVPELCRDLMTKLAAHNPKEEQILYPQADSVLTGPASTELRTFLDSGRMPEGWVCQGERQRP